MRHYFNHITASFYMHNRIYHVQRKLFKPRMDFWKTIMGFLDVNFDVLDKYFHLQEFQ